MKSVKNFFKTTEKGTIIRTILVAVALINQCLVLAGKNTLPFTNDEIDMFLTGAFSVITTLIAWWKNNNFTSHAREAQKYSDAMKAAKKAKKDQPAPAVGVEKPETEEEARVLG